MVEKLDDVLYMDGYDDCLVGHVDKCGGPITALYSMDKLVDRHRYDGMTYGEAVEYVEYNQIGAYMGERTPHFLLPEECE